jgi:hypothetical protein
MDIGTEVNTIDIAVVVIAVVVLLSLCKYDIAIRLKQWLDK